GSRIRTCDLEYPKLPRYQTALYPARVWWATSTYLETPRKPRHNRVSRYTLPLAPAMRSAAVASAAQNRRRDPVAGPDPQFPRGPGRDFEHSPNRPAGGNDLEGLRLSVFRNAADATVALNEDHVQGHVCVLHP